MLLLSPHVIQNDHLHVKSIVPLLHQSLLLELLVGVLDLLQKFAFDALYMGLALEDHFYRLRVLLHLAVYGSFVQIRGNDIVFLLIVVGLQQLLLEFESLVDGSECNSVFFLLFVDAREVVKTEDFEFGEKMGVFYVFV